jgi:hypothetical protein
MNHHAPPGGWQPEQPEPKWLPELRKIDASIQWQCERVTEQVALYIRLRRQTLWAAMLGAWTGYMLAWVVFQIILPRLLR